MVVTSGSIKRGMVETSLCSIGYHILDPHEKGAESSSTPIICLHSSPRSSDEFIDIMPLLSSGRRTIVALDAPGYGISENPYRSCTLEDIGSAFMEAIDGLLERPKKVILFGSLMGNFIVLSLAAHHPELVAACICVNLYYYPSAKVADKPKVKAHSSTIAEKDATAEKEGKQNSKSSGRDDKNDIPHNQNDHSEIPDSWELKSDGSMLAQVYTKRSWVSNDPELNLRISQGEITYLMNRRRRYKHGIAIEDLSTVDLGIHAKKTFCPVLCVKGKASLDFFDAIGLKGTQQFEKASRFLFDHEVKELVGAGSHINLVNQMPAKLASVLDIFLDGRNL
uniref:AB hydrolase-1 domain-containing protein n=1 Tax=Chaetoceros debilis TaxID=122233 RepID=A0A7S3V531_9STRA|mmetsp:Transcript_6247/g.9157  ORF Transcript_6247/g.9157 Transcript_6247/m.9157 type:complete len:337 (+) Transcript_6247:143-1153(+)